MTFQNFARDGFRLYALVASIKTLKYTPFYTLLFAKSRLYSLDISETIMPDVWRAPSAIYQTIPASKALI